jgi:ABC-type proline/glycine betaine transport system ATPase subunit
LDSPESIIENPSNSYVREFVIDNLKLKIDSLIKYVKPGPPENKFLSGIWGKILSMVNTVKPETTRHEETK